MSTSIKRRKFLKALLAASGTAAVGWSALKFGIIPARFRSARVTEHSPDASLGHLLRDGKTFDFSNTPAEYVPTVIVGGGIAGLSAAWWLDRAGKKDFELLELEAEVGGNSAWGGNEVSEYPWGAHYLPIPNTESEYVRLFLQECGAIRGTDSHGKPLYDETMLCADPSERLWIEGRFQEGLVPQLGVSANDAAELRRFFDRMREFSNLNGSDGKPIFSIPLGAGSRDRFTHPKTRALDGMSMATWLERESFRARPVLWYANYGCRDDFGGTTAATSAWAGIHYHASRRGTGANAESGTVLTWPEGNGWLVKKLRDRVQSKIHSRTLVVKVEARKKTGGAIVYAKAGDRLRKIHAEKVILATPRFVASRLVDGADGVDRSKIDYAPWMIANLTLSERPGTWPPKNEGAPRFDHLAWDNVNYYSDSLGYVDATHQTRTIGRETVITLYWPLTENEPRDARRAAEKVSLANWKEKIFVDLERMHPEIRSITQKIDLRVWGHGMVRPSVGFLSGETRARMARSLGDIHFAHSDLSGFSIFEEAQYWGIEAAKKVLRT